jgi:hypothetical protein
MKKFINPILSLGTAVALLGAIYFQNQKIDLLKIERDELTKHMVDSHAIVGGDIQKANTIDSLNDEIFNLQSMNGRYELSLEHLKEVNPKAAIQFENYMSNQTE